MKVNDTATLNRRRVSHRLSVRCHSHLVINWKSGQSLSARIYAKPYYRPGQDDPSPLISIIRLSGLFVWVRPQLTPSHTWPSEKHPRLPIVWRSVLKAGCQGRRYRQGRGGLPAVTSRPLLTCSLYLSLLWHPDKARHVRSSLILSVGWQQSGCETVLRLLALLGWISPCQLQNITSTFCITIIFVSWVSWGTRHTAYNNAMSKWLDGWMDGHTDRRMDGHTEGQMDRN